jgi:hypothetical protein
MRVHFRQYREHVRELDKQIISALLNTHWKAAVLALVQSGQAIEGADARAIPSVDAFAKENFPEMQIDVSSRRQPVERRPPGQFHPVGVVHIVPIFVTTSIAPNMVERGAARRGS